MLTPPLPEPPELAAPPPPDSAARRSPSTVPGAALARFCPVVAVVVVVVVGSPVTLGSGFGADILGVPLPTGAAVGFDGAVVRPDPPTFGMYGCGVAATGAAAGAAGAAAGAARAAAGAVFKWKSASTCFIQESAKTVGDP